MSRKELRHFSKSELLDIIYNMMNEEKDAPADGNENIITNAQIDAERESLEKRAKLLNALKRVAVILLVAASAAVLISTLFLPIIKVSGDSMEPTLHNGDVLLLCKTDKYERGSLHCISWQNKLLLKRVIGLPGDLINIDAYGNVFVNNELIDEPYINEKSLGECDLTFPYQVPEDKLFVLGDQRSTSVDSRSSAIGCVDKNQVTGRVLFKIWPLKEKNK